MGKVNVTNGVAELLAMETTSSMPIEDKVAISLVVFVRRGITAIQTGNEIIPINKTDRKGGKTAKKKLFIGVLIVSFLTVTWGCAEWSHTQKGLRSAQAAEVLSEASSV
jgi:hypothetical protein